MLQLRPLRSQLNQVKDLLITLVEGDEAMDYFFTMLFNIPKDSRKELQVRFSKVNQTLADIEKVLNPVSVPGGKFGTPESVQEEIVKVIIKNVRIHSIKISIFHFC